MKTKRQKQMTFGELIAAAYDEWGPERAGPMVRLAIRTHVVVFPKEESHRPLLGKGKHHV